MKNAVGAIAFIFLVATSTTAFADRNCMNQLAAGGRAIGADVDGPQTSADYETVVDAPTAAKLQPIWAKVSACLNRAYSTHKTAPSSLLNGSVLLWYTQKGSSINWCATPSPGVALLGGSGPEKDWYTIWIACRVNQSSLPDVNKPFFW